MSFGERLYSLRTAAGLTQEALGEQLHVTKSVISYYERHERLPSAEVLIELARIFRVSSDYLLGIGRSRIIDVSDLSESDLRFLLLVVDALRKKNAP